MRGSKGKGRGKKEWERDIEREEKGGGEEKESKLLWEVTLFK